MTDLNEIIIEWQNNPKFRETFKKNPLKALTDAKFTVSEKDLKKITAKLLLKENKIKNEVLDKRINK